LFFHVKYFINSSKKAELFFKIFPDYILYMAFELISSIVTATGLILNGASTYFTGRQSAPQLKKIAVCQRLIRLRTALKAIGETGEKIGSLLNSGTFREKNDPLLGELIESLETQQVNLRAAQEEFKDLGHLFEIKIPKLQKMHIHLRGKADRIEIIYSIASRSTLEPWVKKSLKPWERSLLMTDPHKLLSAIEKSDSRELQGKKFGNADEDFRILVEAIEPLTDFIRDNCEIECIL
jgi:hypothetical protein